jgi:hypothetical protein
MKSITVSNKIQMDTIGSAKVFTVFVYKKVDTNFTFELHRTGEVHLHRFQSVLITQILKQLRLSKFNFKI